LAGTDDSSSLAVAPPSSHVQLLETLNLKVPPAGLTCTGVPPLVTVAVPSVSASVSFTVTGLVAVAAYLWVALTASAARVSTVPSPQSTVRSATDSGVLSSRAVCVSVTC
jgi:hypothetical protein